jgi:glycosyltransferase involved in cell wall biosynthesis
VGFCLLLKRRYLAWLGGFDSVYGHGYCEESDLCMRYTEAGLKVVVAADAFVYHRGCGSFGTWIERYNENRAIFDSRWSAEYGRDYGRFLRRNPLQPVRDRLLRHTVAKGHRSASVVRALDSIHLSRLASGLPPTTASRVASTIGGEPAAAGGASIAAATARPRTALDPERRQVRYPTRAHLETIPRLPGLRVTFLVSDTGVSGGTTSIVQLAREFVLRGHVVNVVTLTEELAPETLNLPLQPLIYPDRESLVRVFPPSDVVVATYWTTAHDYLAPLRRRHDFLSVFFIQDYEANFYPETDTDTRRKVVATYALAEHRIVKSRWLARLIEEQHGLPCEIVPLGLDLGIFRPGGRRRERGRRLRVASAARPHERRRGFAEVAHAFRALAASRNDVEFVFFGTPEAAMPSDLGFPYSNVGPLTNANHMAELLRSCDVLVDSSLYQAFGRPGIEAMACGTSCVLTGEGGVTEYARHGDNCLVVPPGDVSALVAGIQRLLDDEPLRRRLAAAGVDTASRFDHLGEAARHLDLYTRWLAERDQERRHAARA